MRLFFIILSFVSFNLANAESFLTGDVDYEKVISIEVDSSFSSQKKPLPEEKASISIMRMLEGLSPEEKAGIMDILKRD